MPVLRGARRARDEDGLIVARGEHVYAVLNLYPYNSGHLMTVPYRHVADYTDLDDAETAELAQFTQTAMQVICARRWRPHGFNLGINQGAVAGAGIAAHLHQHVVPRWGGDTNFMPVVAQTRVLPAAAGRRARRCSPRPGRSALSGPARSVTCGGGACTCAACSCPTRPSATRGCSTVG